MKKILVTFLLLVSGSVFAHGPHGYGYGYHNRGPGWVPWVGGAVAGAVLYDIYHRPVVVQQQPVIVQQPPVVYQPQQNCGPWIETQNVDGSITRSRTCTQ